MDVVKPGELVGVEDQGGRVQDQLGGRPRQLLHLPGGRGVRCAKSLSIQYFINILQNSLIDVDIDIVIFTNFLVSSNLSSDENLLMNLEKFGLEVKYLEMIEDE